PRRVVCGPHHGGREELLRLEEDPALPPDARSARRRLDARPLRASRRGDAPPHREPAPAPVHERPALRRERVRLAEGIFPGVSTLMLAWGREITGDLAAAERREWLCVNGIGGFGSGTVAGSQ